MPPQLQVHAWLAKGTHAGYPTGRVSLLWTRLTALYLSIATLAAGEIDRETLGRRVFGSDADRRKVNQATHLPVFLELFRQLLMHWLRFEFLVVRVPSGES